MEADAEPGPRPHLTPWLDQHDRSQHAGARRDGDLVAHQDITRHACLDFIFHASRFGADRGFDLQANDRVGRDDELFEYPRAWLGLEHGPVAGRVHRCQANLVLKNHPPCRPRFVDANPSLYCRQSRHPAFRRTFGAGGLNTSRCGSRSARFGVGSPGFDLPGGLARGAQLGWAGGGRGIRDLHHRFGHLHGGRGSFHLV